MNEGGGRNKAKGDTEKERNEGNTSATKRQSKGAKNRATVDDVSHRNRKTNFVGYDEHAYGCVVQIKCVSGLRESGPGFARTLPQNSGFGERAVSLAFHFMRYTRTVHGHTRADSLVVVHNIIYLAPLRFGIFRAIYFLCVRAERIHSALCFRAKFNFVGCMSMSVYMFA